MNLITGFLLFFGFFALIGLNESFNLTTDQNFKSNRAVAGERLEGIKPLKYSQLKIDESKFNLYRAQPRGEMLITNKGLMDIIGESAPLVGGNLRSHKLRDLNVEEHLKDKDKKRSDLTWEEVSVPKDSFFSVNQEGAIELIKGITAADDNKDENVSAINIIDGSERIISRLGKYKKAAPIIGDSVTYKAGGVLEMTYKRGSKVTPIYSGEKETLTINNIFEGDIVSVTDLEGNLSYRDLAGLFLAAPKGLDALTQDIRTKYPTGQGQARTQTHGAGN